MEPRARLRHRIQARVSILVAVAMLGPLAAIALLAQSGGRQLERRTLDVQAQHAQLIAERLQMQLSLDRKAPIATLLRAYKPTAGETVELLDANTAAPPMSADELVASARVPLAGLQVVVRQSRREALDPYIELSRKASIACAVALAIALIFAWGAARSLTRPLSLLTEAAGRISDGDLSHPIPPLDEDEVGILGEALERMRVRLQDSVARRLLAKQIRAQEDERRRVARELHDETTQQLATLVMRLQSGDVKSASELAVQTLDGVHRLIADLRPSVLDDLGLKSAIAWYAEKHLEARGIKARCEFSGLDERLPSQVETAVFRVVQEALTNVERHAHASTVLVQCAKQDGTLEIDVEDDGQGFDLAKQNGWGLLGMRERVEMLGGQLRLDSAPGQGTHVRLEVPVEASHAHG